MALGNLDFIGHPWRMRMRILASVAALATISSPLAAKTIAVAPGPDAQSRLQEALITAEPGDVVELGSGRYQLTDGLSLDVPKVTVRGQGRGGRNAEFALGLAVALDGLADVWALAGDTDGIDGTEANAGAIVAPDTLARAAVLGLSASERLADNDGYGFFVKLDDLVTTGPTHTNVNDFRAIVIR
jgi:hypothetical protein